MPMQNTVLRFCRAGRRTPGCRSLDYEWGGSCTLTDDDTQFYDGSTWTDSITA